MDSWFAARRRSNGDLDFLPADGGEPRGYAEFIATVDTLVIGRKTFETVLGFASWPYGDRRVVVLSSQPLDFSAAHTRFIEQMAGSPAEIVSKLNGVGAHHVYVDGGITIQRFLRAGLIQRLMITRVLLCSSETEFLFSARYRATSGYVKSRLNSIRAAWLNRSTRLWPGKATFETITKAYAASI